MSERVRIEALPELIHEAAKEAARLRLLWYPNYHASGRRAWREAGAELRALVQELVGKGPQ